MLPLYEAKMFHQFDHRWATYDGTEVRDVTFKEKQDTSFVVLPRYWVAEEHVDDCLAGEWDQPWLIAFRDIARATDMRTAILSAIPRVGVGHKSPLINASFPMVIQGLFSSFVFDYVARQKLGGTSLTYFIVKQLPAPARSQFDLPCPWDYSVTLRSWIEDRVSRLSATSADLAAAMSRSVVGWSAEERMMLRAELDAAFFELFGLADDDISYVLDSFPIVRRKDEAEFGTYATKDRVVAVLHELRDAIRMRMPYASPVIEKESAS